MKKLLVLLNMLSLFLTSCGSFKTSSDVEFDRNPSSAGESCFESMKQFLAGKSEKKVTEQMEELLGNSVRLTLNKNQIDDFFKEFSNVEFSPSEYMTLRGIYLTSGDDEVLRRSLLREFHNVLDGNKADPENKAWANFVGHRNKIEERLKKNLAKEKTEDGKKAVSEKNLIYEKLYYSCNSQMKTNPNPSPESLKQSKKLTYALMAGSFGSTAITYTAVNWESEKNSKWFNELYFSLGMGVVLSYLGGKFITANDKIHPWKGKLPMTFLTNATTDAGVSGIYAYLFGVSNSEIQKKLDALAKDPKAQERLQEILKIAEEKGLFEKYAKEAETLFRDKETGKALKLEEIDFDKVDIDATRELLLAAIAEKEYEDNAGKLSTGSKGVDRFSYHRLYNLFSVPTNIGLSLLMRKQMCMTEDPKKGFAKGVAIYMTSAILMDALYFKGRKELINQ